MTPTSAFTPPRRQRWVVFRWSWTTGFSIVALLWIAGWFIALLQNFGDTTAIPADAWGLFGLFAFAPPVGLAAVLVLGRQLHRRGLLLAAIGAVGAIAVLYATLSAFRYDYIRFEGGSRYTQVDTWLARQRLCVVANTNVHCFEWR